MSFRFSGPGMQDVDCPTEIQALSKPAGACRVRIEVKALGVMTGPELRDGIPEHWRRWRHLGQGAAVRPPELERPVGPARHLETLLVHGAMVPTAEEREIRERRGPALRPVS